MKKEKFCIQYIFDSASRNSLWNHLTTSTGLSEWFADDVLIQGNVYTFTWSKIQMEAELLALSPNSHIRFRWSDEEDTAVFFEFRIHTIELTGGIMLEITDFSEDSEKEDSITLWDSQVKVLKRTLGL